ncbi:AbaSI family restriction endonuclease [Flavobacterium qiangtangense]|uniref:AbaSI family restriction endonuclease n=1 Tax=Flavobacterium qiangtangense TaxID=1442595 RepID=A0ABW1PRA4_9FLAO
MKKLNYITRQLARTERKRFEHYVISRIWHQLDDLSIKFSTQQYVIRPSGRALTDMYFPQLGIHIEVDEPHHLNQIEQDLLREADIINATNHKIFRVDTKVGIEHVNFQIQEIVEIIKTAKSSTISFKEWNIELEQNPTFYISKGFIELKDDVAFKNSFLAANCFGHNYKGLQKAATRHPRESNKIIWFPKLYSNSDWDNKISDDNDFIIEKSINNPSHTINILHKPKEDRIVFARVKSPLGDVMYRFKGEYSLDRNSTNNDNGLVWKRISSKVKTYQPIL